MGMEVLNQFIFIYLFPLKIIPMFLFVLVFSFMWL